MNQLTIYKHLKIIKLQNQLINSSFYILLSNTNYLNRNTLSNSNILIEKIIFNFFLKKFNLTFPLNFLKYPLIYNKHNDSNYLINDIINSLEKQINNFIIIVKYNKYLFVNNFSLQHFLKVTSYFALLYKFKKLNNTLFKLFFLKKK
jgi:hypothetical protein